MKKMISLILLLTLLVLSSFSVNSATSISLPNWSVSRATVSEANSKLTIDKNIMHSGNGSLKLECKIDYAPNNYIQIYPSGGLVEIDKEYEFTFWIKGNNVNSGRLMWDWTEVGSIPRGTYDWQQFTYKFYPLADRIMFNILVEASGTIWFDDFSLTKVGDDKNLLNNPGFELGDYTPPAKVDNIEIEVGDSKFAISWANPSDSDFERVNFYRLSEDGQNETFLANSEIGATAYTLTGLVNDEIYMLNLKSEDIYGNESDGNYVFGIPTISKFYATKPEITYSNILSELSTSVTVTNNTLGDEAEIEVITVIYQGNAMTGISSEFSIMNGGDTHAFVIKTTGVQYTADTIVSVYIWDSLNNFIPIGKILK